MTWFFAFTTVGMVIFAFLSAAKKMVRIPFGKLFGGSILLIITGILAIKGLSKSRD